MIDLTQLGKYKENNRIEAKRALGGLPHSIWETYSAFANTLGGIILLGVAEHSDKTLHTVDLPDPERLVAEFWEIVNDPKRTSVNLLSPNDVTIETVNGDHIIVINVPRAQRYYKPVYVDGSPLNAYRRGGEGDYKCTREEYDAMLRDASVQTQDMTILDDMALGVFDKYSVAAYRRRMSLLRPGHAWEQLSDEEFLFMIGAAGIGNDGAKHPTSAGLLMFGRESDILREYPLYFLDYREESDGEGRTSERLLSASGEWSGNVFDFYFLVRSKLQPHTQGSFNAADTAVDNAIGEALANCLINADYYGRGGVVIVRRRGAVTLANPGDFRIEVAAARSGGSSDPRNSILMKMFNLIDIGEHAGHGIPNICYVWKKRGWSEPKITHTYDPNRIELTLPFEKISDENAAASGGKKPNGKTQIQKAMIIEYLTDHAEAGAAELSGLLGIKASRVKELLRGLIEEDIVSAEGTGKNRKYSLRS